MKKIIAINGSPREGCDYNIYPLLKHALEGASSVGGHIETEFVNLWDLNFTGCSSCCECKEYPAGKDYCILEDDLTLLLDKISNCDGIILGSPIFFDLITPNIKALYERMLYPRHTYNSKLDFSKRNIKTCFIYSLQRSEAEAGTDYEWLFETIKKRLESVFGTSDYMVVYNAYLGDYTQICQDRYDPKIRAEIRKNDFPKDCKKAYEKGVLVASDSVK